MGILSYKLPMNIPSVPAEFARLERLSQGLNTMFFIDSEECVIFANFRTNMRPDALTTNVFLYTLLCKWENQYYSV